MTARTASTRACLGCGIAVRKGRILCVSCDKATYAAFKAANRGLDPNDWLIRFNQLFGNREALQAAARAALAEAV